MPDPLFAGWVRVGGAHRWRKLVEGTDRVQVEGLTRNHAHRDCREYVVLPAGMEPDPTARAQPEEWQDSDGPEDDEFGEDEAA